LEAIWEGNSCLLSGGAPDSPVHHRTATVHGPVHIAFLKWHSRPLQKCSHWRTGHCPVHTEQSGATSRPLERATRRPQIWRPTVGSPDSPVNFSRTPPTNSREWPVRQKPAWRTGHCPVYTDSPVCQIELSLGCFEPSSFLLLFSLIPALRQIY
jgi:hypothetical protein